MNKSLRKSQSLRCCSIVEVKSKYGAEFRRFSLDRSDPGKYKDFHRLILRLHHLWHVDVLIGYADVHGELLPINNDNNFCKAVTSTQSLLRIFIQLEEITVTLKDESFMPLSSVFYLNDDEAEQSNVGVDCMMKRKKSPVAFRSDVGHRKSQYRISMPHNFRPVSSIIDVDIVPECHRRVRLHHQGSDRPLGFYIRDGTTVKVTPYGLKKVQGIFISRIVPGGLAESTGLLAINDQVLEVNGIDVSGKSLDQVTDMMIANSRNLIITVKPANQHNNIRRKSCVSSSSRHFLDSMDSVSYPGLPMLMKAYGLTGNGSENEEDRDMIAEGHIKNTSWHSSASTTSYTSHPHVCTSHKPQYFARQPNSLISAASYHSQPCLNYTAHAEQELPLHRHQTPQKHYGSKPSIRQGTSSCSTHDILSTWHIDVSQHLMLHQGEMVEDGIVVIL